VFLERFAVKNYRSILNLDLSPCGDFNVLIGKNNSGKSNILSSIDSLFLCIRPEVILTNPPLGEEIDFFEKDLKSPIAFSAIFRLSNTERDGLLTSISEEQPQVRSLLDNVESGLRLSVCCCITPSPSKFAYVESIRLFNKTPEDGRTLFQVGANSARELYNAARRIEQASSSRSGLERFLRDFDADDYARTRRPRSAEDPYRGPSLDYYVRQLDPLTMGQVTSAYQNTDNYADFTTSITKQLQATEGERDRIASEPIATPMQTFAGEDNVVPKYVRTLLAKINGLKILHFRERRAPIGSDEAKRLLSLKVRRGGPEILARIQSTVSGLLGVKVDAFEATSARRGEPTAELDVDQFLIQVNGSGIREALRLVLDTEFGSPNILLVEEPEIHLHPALETSVMGYLREISGTTQVFITTHSTNFLDTGKFQNVFLVTKERSTSVSPLTLADAEEKLPSELGIRLSSLFMYDKIIFVEGPSDEQILREFARCLNINLGQMNVGFIQMRGVRNLGHYAAAEVVAFLTKRRVKLWFLIDSDEASSVHFDRLKAEFGKAAQIKILRKREIENYLLSPDANIQHIVARKHSSGDSNFKPPAAGQFQTLIGECAERLKPLTIWKRVLAATRRPIYPRDESPEVPVDTDQMKIRVQNMVQNMKANAEESLASLDTICERAVSEVETAWRDAKLDIVPGSALLDEVYKNYGFRFDKMRDGFAIASLLKAGDVDREIQDFMKQL